MTFDQAAAWQFRLDGSNARAAERVLRDFWGKAKRVAAGLPFAEDLIAAYYCALDKATPLQVKAALVGALAYFVLPIDLRPDFLPFVGFTDDAAVLFAVLRLVGGHIRPEHREAARDSLARMQE
jgi:uncharacterized membrane protein YkvA (DUF1232 family)